MAKESLIADTIVRRVALDWRGQDLSLTGTTSLHAVTAILAAFPNLPPGRLFAIYGHAHSLLLPHPAISDQGTRWISEVVRRRYARARSRPG